VLNSKNVIIVEFNQWVAAYQKELFHKYLINNKELNKLAKDLEIFPDNLKLAREWITRDFMIISNAAFYNVDLILTNDTNFYKISDLVKQPCVIVDKENFITSGSEEIVYGFK